MALWGAVLLPLVRLLGYRKDSQKISEKYLDKYNTWE